MFFIESYYHLTLANYIQIKEQRLIIKERMSGYIYCKIYYGIWVPDFALDGQKAIICNTIFRRWCWLGFCCELRRWIRQELAQNELIQSWILYIGGLGGNGAGGTGCRTATCFSVFIFLISLNVTSRLSVGKT